MFDTGLTSAFSEDTPIFTASETGRPGDLQRLLLDPQTRVEFHLHRNPGLLLPRAFEAHPRCRVGTLIRLDMARTRSTVLCPPMGTQLSIGSDVVASTPNGFLLGNPFWGLGWGHLGTGATHPFLVRVRLGRSNRPVEPRNLIVKRHMSTSRVGHSMALNEHRLYPGRSQGPGIYHQTPRQIQVATRSTSWNRLYLRMFDTGLTWPFLASSDARKPSAHVGMPRVFFVAGAGFEPATFGL
jgi:hypothetical protein